MLRKGSRYCVNTLMSWGLCLNVWTTGPFFFKIRPSSLRSSSLFFPIVFSCAGPPLSPVTFVLHPELLGDDRHCGAQLSRTWRDSHQDSDIRTEMRAAAAAFLAAALCLFLSADHAVAAAAASSVHVVSSSTDVSAFAAAAARDNAVVHASWVGPVTLHEPIKVKPACASGAVCRM